MANDAKTTDPKEIHPNLPGNGLSDTSRDALIKQQDSLIESLGAFRFALARIDLLEGQRRLLRDMLCDCRECVEKHGREALMRLLDRTLETTSGD